LQEAFAVHVFLVEKSWVGWCHSPEYKIVLQESERSKHTVALGPERAGCAALRAPAAFPEDGDGSCDAPAKGSLVGSSTIVSNEDGRGARVFKE
jgi:hypothetical protein